MKQRIVSALLGIVLLAFIICFRKVVIIPALVILSFIALWEFNNAFKNKYNSMMILSYIFAGSNFLFLIYEPDLIVQNTVAYMISLMLCIVFKNHKYNIDDICVTFFGYMYTVVFCSFIFLLIKLDMNSLFYLLLLFAISWGADTGGYFIGVMFGKHKLCEKLSPKKTIEGAIGGLIFSIIFSLIIVFTYSYFNLVSFSRLLTFPTVIFFILAIIVLSALSQIGDLIASSIKRYAGIKDFSNIMPGHGGVLDRFDSTLFIAPILYYIISLYSRLG